MDFKNYIENINEKSALMQRYDDGKINLDQFEFKILSAGKDKAVDEILKFFGYNWKVRKEKEIVKIVSKLKTLKYLDLKYLSYIVWPSSESDIKSVDNWLRGSSKRDKPDFIGWEFEKDAIKYYNEDKNKKVLIKAMRQMIKTSENITAKNYIRKVQAQTGINIQDLIDGFKWIDRFRSLAGRTIDKSVYPFLKALSVNKSNLPKKVYRGIFMDGDKFNKKKPKEQETYEIGNEILLRNTKATSWSTSKGVAVAFMRAQDKIKNEEDGFELLISYEIKSIDDIIADFRMFPDMRFFNQQEILIDTSVKYGKVEAIIRNGEEVNLKDVIKTGDSAGSMEMNDYINNIIGINSFNLPLNTRIKLKELIDLPFIETYNRYPSILDKWANSAEILKKKSKLLTPLAVSIGVPDKVFSPTKVQVQATQPNISEWTFEYRYKSRENIKKVATALDRYKILVNIELISNRASNFSFLFDIIDFDLTFSSSFEGDREEIRKIFISEIEDADEYTKLEWFIPDSLKFNRKNVNFKVKIDRDYKFTL